MLRTLAFGDLETGSWGTIWDLGDDLGFALLAQASEAQRVDARIAGSGAEVDWQVSGSGVELEVSPEGEATALGSGFDQLVRVRGRWTAGGAEVSVDCLGRRGERDGIDAGRFEAVRDVSAWFEPDLGYAVVAARPRGSNGHSDDVLSASVLEEGHGLAVAEPRLSTSYTSSGLPTRASLELWLEPPDADREQDDDEVHRFPRRAGGEAVGAQGDASNGSLTAHAELLRWHARGRQGAGVYVLARLAES